MEREAKTLAQGHKIIIGELGLEPQQSDSRVHFLIYLFI